MQKSLGNVVVAGVLLLLAGCQTTSGPGSAPGLFSTYPSTPSFPSSNTGLAQAVQDALSRNPDPMIATRVRVETNQNTVILSGYVKKIRQSDVAEQIARQVSGGQNVQNNIIVRP